MDVRSVFKSAIIAVIACAAFLGAARRAGADDPHAIVINSAAADLSNNEVVIVGQHFGGDPSATLGDLPLVRISAADTVIRAVLPASIAAVPGSYRLVVSDGRSRENSASFDLAVGAVGPQGPQGVVGPAGPQGPAGPAGADGSVAAIAPISVRAETDILPGRFGRAVATCPAGATLVGGGFQFSFFDRAYTAIVGSLPTFVGGATSANAWAAEGFNDDAANGATRRIYAVALCATTTP